MPHDPGGRPAISPGFVKTPATDATVAGELGTFIMNLHPIRRAGTGDDIAYLAAYLASDESSRRQLLASPRALLVKGILPAAGGLALLAAFAWSVKSYWPASSSTSSLAGVGGIFLIGAGSLLAGVALMLVARWRLPAFFTGGTLPTLRRPDAGSEAAGRPAGAPEPLPGPATGSGGNSGAS